MMNRNYYLILFLLLSYFSFGQEVTLYQQFLGKYDFTMIGNTMNAAPNGNGYCDILTSSSATLNLSPDQDIQAAYLYWGGSGTNSQFDFNIKLNGVAITPSRTFANDIAGRGVSGGFADVTAQLLATGNGTYTVSDFDLTNVIPDYCGNGTNFGGWSILIVYRDLSLSSNLVNIYDGFSRVDSSHTFIQFQLNNLNVLHLAGNKVGFLAWEGDENIAIEEYLRINNNIVSNPPLNPANNVFNGTNSFTNSNTLYNMDIDYFDISAYTNIGDASMSVSIESHQDAVVINNMVVVLNSEVPDATISAEGEIGGCDDRDIEINYTVYNTIATDILPAGTPIAFYAAGELIGQSTTVNDIPIGGHEDGQIVLTIPMSVPNNFTLMIVVDDDGTGNGTVTEFNEENNTFSIQIKLGVTPEVNPFEGLQKCDTNNNGSETFDLTVVGTQMLGVQTDVLIRYYTNANDADQGNNNNIVNPTTFTNQTNPQTIYVRMEDFAGCYITASFLIEIVPPAEFGYSIPNLEFCSPTMNPEEVNIDLTQNQDEILNGNNPVNFIISYHHNQNDAMTGNSPIANPTNYQNTTSPETIWARMVDADGCVTYGSFQIFFSLPEEMTYTIDDITDCAENQIIIGIPTNLTQNQNDILNGNNPNDYTISYHLNQNDAQNGLNSIPNPTNYQNTSSPQTIWVRLLNNGSNCVLYGSFQIIYNAPPIAENATIQECSMFGPALFDLNELNSLVVANTNGLNFTYYSSEDDAENQSNPLPTSYTPPEMTYTIYVRVQDGIGCYTIVKADLESVVNTSELTNTYFECDSPYEANDGIAEFDLTQLNSDVINSLNIAVADITYHTSVEDAISGNNPIQNPETYQNTSSPQTLYARAISTDGNCGGVVNFDIGVLSVPEFELPDYFVFCSYDENKSYTFLEPYISYVWRDPSGEVISTSPTVEFNVEGIYTLEVRETADGCVAIRNIEVIIDQPPVIQEIKVEDHTVTIFATGGYSPYNYSIDNGLTWEVSYILNNIPGGLYDLLVRSKYGCISDAKFFGVLGIPNFISPNGDGINDYWSVRGLEAYPEARIKIFDRYGKMFMDRKLGENFSWDGRYKGEPIQSGDYWYIISFEDGKQLSGHITVRNY